MAVSPDHWISEMVRQHSMIEPYARNRLRTKRISYGVSSYGYDFRLSNEYKIPALDDCKHLDPKKIDRIPFHDHKGAFCWIPPNSFILGRSLEYFRIPRNVLVVCQGKSTYARCGIVVNVTPLEPEWEGFVTISLINASRLPAKVYSREGIGQAIFFRGDGECKVSYRDKRGKYQAQKTIQLARI